MADAEVIIPELVTLVDIKGSTPKQDYAAHITFRGLTFAYSDWNLAEVDGSHGNATGLYLHEQVQHRKLARRYVPFL